MIELASPRAPRDLRRPRAAASDADRRPDRDFSGQRFSWHRAVGTRVEDLGVGAATRGLVTARIVRDGAAKSNAISIPVGEGEVLEVAIHAR